MIDLSRRIADLSPEKRALLELRLMKRGRAVNNTPEIPRRMMSGPCPLSFAQQRLWFLHQFEPDSPVYNMPKAVRLSGALNVGALQQALDGIVARHEVLRTTFASIDGNPAQVVEEPRPMELTVIDLREWPEAEREAEAHRRLTQETRRPFDLSRDWPLRATLVRLDTADHMLLLTTHHIASDGWSAGILMRELAALYEACSRGAASPLPELPIQYADYALWQRAWLQGEVLDSQLAYWREQLRGSRSVLELPTDRPRPAVQTFAGAKHVRLLPPALLEALNALSRREGVTLFMTLLAAFQTWLHRYTGQADILVGTPIAGRNRVETETLVGVLVNTLVMRTNLADAPPFREVLERVRAAALGAYAHQELPFERLVEDLQPERSLSHSPLFQVMFILQNAPRVALDLAGLVVTPVEVDSGTAKFDLTLALTERADGLQAVWEYNTELFEVATIGRLAGHFQTLLEGVVAQPEQRLSSLPLLTPAEQQQVLMVWNATEADYPRDQGLHELFEAQVARTPEAVALMYEDQQLTYGELNRRANQLAHHLRGLGLKPEGLVGICVERSLELVVGVLGILKAGGAYVPLDPAFPRDRLAFMVADAQLLVLVTQRHLVPSLPAHGARVVCLDQDWPAIAQEREENPLCPMCTEHLAYVIYTSGSTGQPKGVQITHGAVANFLRTMCQQPGLTAQDSLLAVTTLAFDISAFELFLPLSVGGRVIVISRDEAADGDGLSAQLRRTGATVMQATPATWRLLIETGWPGSHWLKILCGGEALPRPLANQLLERGGCLWNLYGPTETTIWSAACQVEGVDEPVPIGRPIANTQFYVLDPRLESLPVGVPGELYIGGVGLARGYLNRPGLTADKFVPHPFSQEGGARLYKAGDLVRRRLDGTLEFLGRVDHQVKVRGFRIELAEIEAVLAQHPAVRQTVVVAREDRPGEKRLVAYVVPNPVSQQALPIAALRSFLQARLPDYMVPAAFVALDALPLTPNGKVDRRALPIADPAHPERRQTFAAPRDVLEGQLTTIWEEVLGIQSLGVTDNFFELGGHSLLAVRLFAHIERTFGKKLPLATLFQAPTVEQLATMLRQDGWSPPTSSLVAIRAGASKPPFFCVHAHGGEVLIFKGLAKYLGLDQPFYGLQALGLHDDQPRHRRVEEMAAHYLKEIRTIQPEGPYFLGGYCFGGKVAFEMAQQLHMHGQEVALLTMLDAYAPGYPRKLPWVQRAVIQRINVHVGNLWRLRPKDQLHYIAEKGRIGKKRVETRLKGIARKVYQSLGRPLPPALQEVQATNRRPVDPYVPRVYPGKIVLFRPSQQPEGCYHDPDMGWRGLAAGGLEIYEVPGKFGSIIKAPYVRVMAEHLQACLHKAQKGAGSPSHTTPQGSVHRVDRSWA